MQAGLGWQSVASSLQPGWPGVRLLLCVDGVRVRVDGDGGFGSEAVGRAACEQVGDGERETSAGSAVRAHLQATLQLQQTRACATL